MEYDLHNRVQMRINLHKLVITRWILSSSTSSTSSSSGGRVAFCGRNHSATAIASVSPSCQQACVLLRSLTIIYNYSDVCIKQKKTKSVFEYIIIVKVGRKPSVFSSFIYTFLSTPSIRDFHFVSKTRPWPDNIALWQNIICRHDVLHQCSSCHALIFAGA